MKQGLASTSPALGPPYYKMLDFIDRGAFGEVTLAQHLLTRTKVAVKTTKNTSSYFMIRMCHLIIMEYASGGSLSGLDSTQHRDGGGGPSHVPADALSRAVLPQKKNSSQKPEAGQHPLRRYSVSTPTALSLSFQDQRTSTRQHLSSRVTAFSSKSSNHQSWTEGPTTRTHNLTQANCQTVSFSVYCLHPHPTSYKSTILGCNHEFHFRHGLCFLYDQTKDYCHWWNTTYGGCPYSSCVIHKPQPPSCPNHMLAHFSNGSLALNIRDPGTAVRIQECLVKSVKIIPRATLREHG
uniref:uncharacterized protein LOC118153104 n=1 Tax=Callithrix jacchus TaxID=9483 RepID=UPI0023DD5422|nr:uncharacterized protein LOC118153104 [Callithrix jacchus]